ncbi:MAG: FHA domain-containing protein [Gammaproteobacteria bacterium]|jgi:hypothetical protein|nr:FHA domain-containing protein [Gammaproteobacteria bacterium]
MRPRLKLEALEGSGRGTASSVELPGLPCVIGRSKQCELRLNLDRISRQHCRLRHSGKQLLVEDLGSTNGTFVNNERIHIPTLLRPGDTLHIADYAFRLVEDEHPGAGSARAGRAETLAGQTIVGFTEDPTGFPVQAPQFYEILNEARIDPLATLHETVDGSAEVLVVTACSSHPSLQASHERLATMARQLGEEARYHSIVRQAALEAAHEAGIEQQPIALPVDAVEIEDIQLLLNELADLVTRFKRLRLALLVDPTGLDPETVRQLPEALREIGIELALLRTEGSHLDIPAAIWVGDAKSAEPRPLPEFF